MRSLRPLGAVAWLACVLGAFAVAGSASAQGGPALAAPLAVDPEDVPLPPAVTYGELLPPLPKDSAAAAARAIDAAKEAQPAPGAVSAVEGPAPALEAEDPAALAVESDSAASAAPSWWMPAYWFGPAPWDSGFELGLNGSTGTSESISYRTGGFLRRETTDYKLDLSLYYNDTHSNGLQVQSNALLNARYDWLFADSPWSVYVLSQTFYDEFQAFDLNFSIASGVAYQWFKTDRSQLTTSFGPGASRKFGGVEDRWVAEANFGVKFNRQLDSNKKFYTTIDYFPQWDDFSRYRVLSDVGLEIELNQPSNMSLKLSATDRYDSQPGGVSPHILNYSALLIWKL